MRLILSVILGLAMVSCFAIIAKCTIELGKIPGEVMKTLVVGKDAIKDKIYKTK